MCLGHTVEVKLLLTQLCMRMSKYIYENHDVNFFRNFLGCCSHVSGPTQYILNPTTMRNRKGSKNPYSSRRTYLNHIYIIIKAYLTFSTWKFFSNYKIFSNFLDSSSNNQIFISCVHFPIYVTWNKNPFLGQILHFIVFLGSCYRKLNALSNEPNFRS